MNARRRITTLPNLNRDSSGYSMIEMLVAIGMAAVIGMGLYAIFSAQQRSSRSQKAYNELQTSCTFAMDTIKNDLLLAGFEAKGNSAEPISATGLDTVTFEFLDEKASIDPPYDDVTQYSNHSQVRYWLDGKLLKKTVERWHKTTSPEKYDAATTFELADGIESLKFQYVDKNNVTWDPAVTATRPFPLADTRAVRVSLVCASQQKDALFSNPNLGTVDAGKLYQKIALTAEVRPRNIAVSENIEDKSPPAIPLTKPGPDGASPMFKSWDTGQCGCLQVKFTSNTDSDIAGYTVYYGLAAGSYLGRIRVVHQDGGTQTTELRNLTATDTPYFIAVAAYDKSGNQSALSTETSADPDPSVRVEAGTDSDTAINPLGPPAPGSPTVGTPADNELLVGWTNTYSDCLTSPTYGYRLYRSTNPDFIPLGASAGTGNCIADESTLDHGKTSYRDTGADTAAGYLVGCAEYHYKIAVVNCDPSQLTNFTNPGADTTTTYTAASFASVTGTPTDGTETSSPVLTSAPGYRRIILSVTNPSRAVGQHPDFVATRIYFSTAGFPVLTDTRDVEGYNVVNDPGGGPARMIPDHGAFETAGGGPHTVNFDHETLATPPGGIGVPQLNRDATYYFLALSYDRCKNVSQDTEQAKSTADQCNDCNVGYTCRNSPPPPTNVRVTQGCDGAPLRLEWDYPDANYTTHPDFQGFRVIRCTGEGCIPTDPFLGGSGTVRGDLFYLAPDKWLQDDLVADGQTYSYRVYAADCYYQRWLEGLLDADDKAANWPGDNADFSDITGLSLGYFDRVHIDGDQETTLTAAIGAADTTIPVASTTGWTHRMIQIDSEVIQCNGVTATALTDCWWRGAEATIPIAHLAGTFVRSYPPAPTVAAITGDLALVPPTFLHNIVKVGAINTSAGTIRLDQLSIAWDNTAAWLSDLLYDNSVTAFHDSATPLTHGASGTTITLSPIVVDAFDVDIPLKLTFLKSDGTADATVDLREEELDVVWFYRNNATGVDTCSRDWIPPSVTGIVAPVGPVVGGTTQSAPTWGTVSWPVPGPTSNPLDAVIAPSDSWNNIYTNVHDNSGKGIASVRLYYATTDRAVTTAPELSGGYPGCAPYTMVEMSSWGWSDIWSTSIPKWPAQPGEFNDRNVWYFIVAVDNEGNFDREPEQGFGSFQYFQQPADPCLTWPQAPQITLSSGASSVTLDWSAGWWEWMGVPPKTYFNTNGTPSTDLAGFRVYHRIGIGAWNELTPPPPSALAPTEAASIYTHTFGTPATSTLTWQLDEVTAAVVPLSVADPSVFRIPGKVKIGDEVFRCTARDTWHLNNCSRAQDGSVAAFHSNGAVITQDLLALETNSYYVRAFDDCAAVDGGPKYTDSSVYSEGTCSPLCRPLSPGTTIAPGDPLWLNFEACQKRNGTSGEKIYLHVCSTVEGDDVELTESGDSGWFQASLPTQLYAGALVGGNTNLMVSATDTVTIGGFSNTVNSWPSINSCTDNFSCGPAQTVAVVTPVADPCAGDYTPNPPGSVTKAKVGSCTNEAGTPNNTNKLTLTWNKVTPPAGCTSFTYKAYYCNTAGCTPTSLSPITGFTSTCGATTCTSDTITMGSNLKNPNVYRFTVTAVCAMDTCTNPVRTQTWESTMSSPVTDDPCP